MSVHELNSMILLHVLVIRQADQGERVELDLCAEVLQDHIRLN